MRSFTDRWVKRTPLPPDPSEVEAFEIWKRGYESLVERGEERGWLHTDMDGAQYIGAPSPSGYEERPETDEEYAARQNDPDARMKYDYAAALERTLLRTFDFLYMPVSEKNFNGDGTVTFPVYRHKEDEE